VGWGEGVVGSGDTYRAEKCEMKSAKCKMKGAVNTLNCQIGIWSFARIGKATRQSDSSAFQNQAAVY
jgi:hypothetical protein